MSKLIAALVTVPLLGFVFFYFFTHFHKSNIDFEIATQRLERDWAEVRKNSPFTTETDKQKYEQRAAEAEQKIKELEEKKKEKEKKLEKLTDDFEQALKEALDEKHEKERR